MKTIYIKGITHYKKYIRKTVLKSELKEGQDFIEGYAGQDHALYWLNENIDLRTFKRAVGAKYVWRHRIRFYESIEEMNKKTKKEDDFNSEDLALLNKIKKNYYGKNMQVLQGGIGELVH